MAFDDEIEDPADSYNDAVWKADKHMLLAQHAYEESETAPIDTHAALLVARATYHQTRALAFYQLAALIGADN